MNAEDNVGTLADSHTQAELETPSPESETTGTRDAKGRFTAGNSAALVHGKYAVKTLDDAAVADEARKILRELGLPLGTVDFMLASRLVQVDALANSCGLQIQHLGATTPRGRKRAIVNVYLDAVATQMKLAERLGYRPGKRDDRGDSLYDKSPAELAALAEAIRDRFVELAQTPPPPPVEEPAPFTVTIPPEDTNGTV